MSTKRDCPASPTDNEKTNKAPRTGPLLDEAVEPLNVTPREAKEEADPSASDATLVCEGCGKETDRSYCLHDCCEQVHCEECVVSCEWCGLDICEQWSTDVPAQGGWLCPGCNSEYQSNKSEYQ